MKNPLQLYPTETPAKLKCRAMARNKEEGQGLSARQWEWPWLLVTSSAKDPGSFCHCHIGWPTDFTDFHPIGFHVYRSQIPEFLCPLWHSLPPRAWDPHRHPAGASNAAGLQDASLDTYSWPPSPCRCSGNSSSCAPAHLQPASITNLHGNMYSRDKTVQPWEFPLIPRASTATSASTLRLGPCCFPWPLTLCVCLQPAPLTTLEPAVGAQSQRCVYH